MLNNLPILSATSFSPATCGRGSLASLLATRVVALASCQCAKSIHFHCKPVGRARNTKQIMQNKANLQNNKMNITTSITRDYEIFMLFGNRKNKAKQSQFKPNFRPILALFSPILALFLTNDYL